MIPFPCYYFARTFDSCARSSLLSSQRFDNQQQSKKNTAKTNIIAKADLYRTGEKESGGKMSGKNTFLPEDILPDLVKAMPLHQVGQIIEKEGRQLFF